MSIFRIRKDKDNPYVMLNKEMLNDANISLKAKGLLAYMLSMPDDWQFYEVEILKHCKEGRTAVRSTIKELIENGYIDRRQQRKQNGKFTGYEYQVYETKNRVTKSDIGKSDIGKSNSTNNDLSNNKINNNLHPSEDAVILNINKYCKERFDKQLRQCSNVIILEALENMDSNELAEFLDNNIQSYEQCNLDYIEAIQYRAL